MGASEWTLVASLMTVLVLPGLVLLVLVGARGSFLVAAPAVSAGIFGAAVPVFQWVGAPWNPVTVSVWVVLLSVITWGARRVKPETILTSATRRRKGEQAPAPQALPVPSSEAQIPEPLSGAASQRSVDTRSFMDGAVVALLGAATIAGSVLAGSVMYRTMRGLDQIHQEWDSVFHSVAVKAIADGGSVGLADVGSRISPSTADTFFYPLGWHAVSALAVQLGLGSVIDVTNAMLIVTAALSVPVMVGFVWSMSRHRALTLATAIVTPWAAPFPYDLLWRGPLSPFALALVVSPAVVILAMWCASRRSYVGACILGVTVAGILSIHAGTAVSLATVLFCWWVFRAVSHRGRGLVSEILIFFAAGVFAAGLAMPSLLKSADVVGVATDVDWKRFASAPDALWYLLSGSDSRPAPQWLLVVLVVIGIAAGRAVMRPLAWWLAVGAVWGFLYVAAASNDREWVQDATKWWWNDAVRLSAMFWQAWAVAAAAGLVALGQAAIRGVWWVLRPSQGVLPLRGLAEIAAVCAFGVAGFTLTGGYADAHVRQGRYMWDGECGISEREKQAWQRFTDTYGTDHVILNDPNDGSVWAHVLYNVDTVWKQRAGSWQVPLMSDAERALFFDAFRGANDARVRDALRQLDVQYVVIGTPDCGRPYRQPGLGVFDDPYWVDDTRTFEELPDIGPLRIWRVNST